MSYFLQDPWLDVRPLIDGFNQRRIEVIIPGTRMTVDELMSMWRGYDGAYVADGLPQVTKIQRKPEGVGKKQWCVIRKGTLY